MHTKTLHPRQLPSASSGACAQRQRATLDQCSLLNRLSNLYWLSRQLGLPLECTAPVQVIFGASLRYDSERGLWLMWNSGIHVHRIY